MSQAAQRIFNQFCEGYKNRDVPYLLGLFTEHSTVWGSGPDEYRVGLNEIETQFHRDWSHSEQCEIEIIDFVPTPLDASWAAVVCTAKVTIDGQLYEYEQLRLTITITKEHDDWKITHMHASLPDYSQVEQRSVPMNN